MPLRAPARLQGGEHNEVVAICAVPLMLTNLTYSKAHVPACRVGSMKLAAAAAKRLGKPWVLDPVGCGATPYRSQVRLLTVRSLRAHRCAHRCVLPSVLTVHSLCSLCFGL